MKGDRFRCEWCKGEFIRGSAEGEADAEFHKDFPGVPDEEGAMVCHDCYLKIMEWIAANPDKVPR